MKKILILCLFTFMLAQHHALEFDGLDDWVELPDLGSSNFVTLEMWCDPGDNFDTIRGLIGRPSWWTAGDFHWTIGTNEKLGFDIHYGAGVYTEEFYGDTNLSNDNQEWIHLAITYQAGVSIKLYVNGQLEMSAVPSISTPLNLNELHLGHVHWDDRYFSGLIREMKISNDINYSDNFTPPVNFVNVSGQTLVLYDFSNVVDGILLDAAGNNNAIIHGASLVSFESCNDPYACNYESLAIQEDGTCKYNDLCGVCDGDNTACDIIVDYDGNEYGTVEIGDQKWMRQNLKTTHYRNGDSIETVYDYANDPSNSVIYGKLYRWGAIDLDYTDYNYNTYEVYIAEGENRGICPEDYHVPSYDEFVILTDYLGGNEVAGPKLRETGTEHWEPPNSSATNESGFTALPGGVRLSNNFNDSNTGYAHMGIEGNYWTSSEAPNDSLDNAWTLSVYGGNTALYESVNKYEGNGIRCIEGIEGCTDSESLNYDETADFNTGCLYLGDVNGDLTVDIADVVTLVAYVVQNDASYNLETIQTTGEINNDGIINVIDVVLLVNIIVNQ